MVEIVERYAARPVRVASVTLSKEAAGREDRERRILDAVRDAAKKGTDLIITPEAWSEELVSYRDGAWSSAALDEIKGIAAEYHTYVVACLFRYAREEEVQAAAERNAFWTKPAVLGRNSSFLVNRSGKVVYIYDKVYPYMPEFIQADGVKQSFEEMKTMPANQAAVIPGDHAGVYDCDFGRLGMAICFDMNFPELWRQMAIAGVELTAWSSAFDGGTSVSAYAACNNYYIVSSTIVGTGGIRVEDVNGKELIYQLPAPGKDVNCVEVTLNLDRTVFHKNFNEGKLKEIQERYGEKALAIDDSLYATNEWLVVSSNMKGITMKDLCREYGLVPLQRFKTTAVADYIDSLRGGKIYWDL